jgi:hypothetical protein
LHKTIHFGAHHLDGERARVLDERVFARVIHRVGRRCSRSRHASIIALCRVLSGPTGNRVQ